MDDEANAASAILKIDPLYVLSSKDETSKDERKLRTEDRRLKEMGALISGP